ncbi:SF1B family DNA helicase RecD2 [Bacillus cereus]
MNIKQFEAKVTKVIFRNLKNHYSILLARVDGVNETLIGYFPVINEGITIEFFGKKEIGRNKREQYRVESYSIELPSTNHQLYYFLINDFINMDLKLASTIVDKIGTEYITKYKDKKYIIEKLGEPYFDEYKEDIIKARLRLDDIQNKLLVMESMVNMGFPNDVSAKVAFSEFKITPLALKSNPYQLIFPFDLNFQLIDNIALNNGTSFNGDLRIHEGICFLLDEAVSKYSHIYLPREELLSKLNRLLKINISLDTFKKHELILEEQKRIYCDVELHIYGYRYFQAELQLSQDLYRLNDGNQENLVEIKELMNTLSKDSIVYSDEQLTVIEEALLYPLTIISGAAGTGKTTLLRKIIRLLETMKNKDKKITDPDYYRICLCAPTGKAAERMKEVTGKEARTIHSILNLHPIFKTPTFHQDNPLDCDCLIIDESSMNDTILFSHILNAAKENCKVIIVGDNDQLPAIGPGNVLTELLNSEEFRSFRLSRVYRQGSDSNILDLATAIREGNSDVAPILYKKTDDFTFIENNNVNELSNIIVKTVDILYNKPNLDFYKDIQIVTPMHKSPIGTMELNYKIQKLLNEKSKRKKISVGDKDFYIGDKVIHTVNNNDKKVYNGETGKIISIINKIVTVEFSNSKECTYAGDELFELDLAFALSVHKMQGSESAIVIFPIHYVFSNMLQRKLIYTGITRAKQKLLLMGQVDAVARGIKNDTSESRNCNLAQRLIESRLTHLFR